MASELKIPEVGESITEVQIARWLKAKGDVVKADEAVAVIDSEKTTFELPSPAAGRLSKILHQAGDRVRVGDVVAEIEASNGETKEKPGPKKESKPRQKETAKAPEKKTAPESKKPEPTPVEEETAKEEEVEEPEVKEESQPARKAEAKTPEPKAEKKPVAGTDGGESETVPMTMLRKTVARRLVEAQQTMAMLTTFNEIDMSAVQALRHEHQEAFEKRHQVKLGLMSFFVKAAIDALKQVPQLNAEIRGEDIVYHNHFDIGVAIATERGLVVPVLRGAERMSFAEVEKKIGESGTRAKAGQLNPDDLAGGTFTITNGGVFGSLLSTPIINPPQSGILGMHTIQDRPMAVNGQVVIRPMMYVALTYDHRLVDGREAVVFLKRIKDAVENPARMLIEI